MNELEMLLEAAESRSRNLLQQQSDSEREDWYNHSCTQAFLEGLKADIYNNTIGWKNGSYVEESVDGSKQKNAYQIGQVQKVEDIIEYIHDIRKGEDSDRDEDRDE